MSGGMSVAMSARGHARFQCSSGVSRIGQSSACGNGSRAPTLRSSRVAKRRTSRLLHRSSGRPRGGQSVLVRSDAKPSATACARSTGGAQAEEHAKEPEMLRCRRGGRGDHRQIQATSDNLGNVARRHAILGDRVVAGAAGGVFQDKPVEARCIETMHRRPPVVSIADIG